MSRSSQIVLASFFFSTTAPRSPIPHDLCLCDSFLVSWFSVTSWFGLMARTDALIVERLFWFVSLTRLVFSTLITNDVCSLGPWRAVSQASLFLRLPLPTMPKSLSLSAFRARFLVCARSVCSLVVGSNPWHQRLESLFKFVLFPPSRTSIQMTDGR